MDVAIRVYGAALSRSCSAAGRPVSFIPFAVPQYQREDSYFAPLAELTGAGTELNFALVPYHPTEQTPGTTEAQVRLIDAARAGRDEIPGLLDLHRRIVSAG